MRTLAQIEEQLSCLPLSEVAYQTHFQRQSPKKVELVDLLMGFVSLIQTHGNTLEDWSVKIALRIGDTLAPQSLWEKLHPMHEAFARALLSHGLDKLAFAHLKTNPLLFAAFSHVYLEDSTCLKLPDQLAWCFPGNYSHGEQKAVAKLQHLYELREDRTVRMSLEAFSRNDQAAAYDSLNHVWAGDLLIRDMGYFVLPALAQIKEKKAFFLSRLPNKVNIYDLEGNPLDIMPQLRKYGFIDRQVRLGAKEQVAVRLVAKAVPEEVKAARIRKAKQNRDKRLNPSKRTFELMGYNILITNVDASTWTVDQAIEAYGFRWRIEIVFKCYKKHFQLDQIIQFKNNSYAVKIYIYYMLLYIICCFWSMYHQALIQTWEQKKRYLSLLKYANFHLKHPEIRSAQFAEEFIDQLIQYYCVYDKRKNLSNHLMLILYELEIFQNDNIP